MDYKVNEVIKMMNHFYKKMVEGFELVQNGVCTPEKFDADLTQRYLDILDMREDLIGRYSDEEIEVLDSMYTKLDEYLDKLADILEEQFGY
ncbi:hypothetical protein JXA27_09940 [Aerococcaceae bacterium zg-B36]|uniref:hypothetical protein n=1 Tax=Aerococcaceae bacterium zg-252 TaxID=2796928 RepID=UPI001BD83463|nr:hypothetical protein [Aerococcaceae bacterium zg-B36]